MLIKDNIPRNVDTTSRNVKAPVPLVKFTVSYEHTLFSPEVWFVNTIGSKILPAGSSKGFYHGEIRLSSSELLNGSAEPNDPTSKSIY
jgi:hypothetical protein